MDQKKLEKLENIKNYLENDDIAGLNKYVERIKPAVKEDEDFLEIFEELKSKNYDQALFITEDILLDAGGEDDYAEGYDNSDLDDFDEKTDFTIDEPVDDLEDFKDDFNDDFNDDFTEDQFDDDLTYFEDKDDDYY